MKLHERNSAAELRAECCVRTSSLGNDICHHERYLTLITTCRSPNQTQGLHVSQSGDYTWPLFVTILVWEGGVLGGMDYKFEFLGQRSQKTYPLQIYSANHANW